MIASLSVLSRVALHQTRLSTPGLGLDAKGVALGSQGIVLLPSIDRLVAWLSVYTREHSLEDLLASLEIRVMKSKLGVREITISVAAESSDRMDRIAETARLVGGFTFTGTSRHFVQYRDAGAPFGYDTTELVSTDAPLVVYHEKFSQVYMQERQMHLRALLLKLMPHVDPSTHDAEGVRLIVTEEGLGPALIQYFVRSSVDAEVSMAEWPPASSLDEAKRRYVFRVPDLPKRMRPLLTATPGMTTFLPAGPGVFVEIGHRHPVSLRACPVFDAQGLVLMRGGGETPWILPKAPQLGDVRAFARVTLRDGDNADVARATKEPGRISVPFRVVPSTAPWKHVTASVITRQQLPLLRRLAYSLSRETLKTMQVALTNRGVVLSSAGGVESIPLGTFYVEIHPSLFIPAGFDVLPQVSPEVLHQALQGVSGVRIFLDANTNAFGVESSAFANLETMLLESANWEPLVAEEITRALSEKPVEIQLEGLNTFSTRGIIPEGT